MTLTDIRHRSDAWILDLLPRVEDMPGGSEAMALRVPGRIELLGKHTDYAGGISLTCASTRKMTGVAVRTEQPVFEMIDVSSGQRMALSLTPPPEMQGWYAYPSAAARRLLSHAPTPTSGVRLVFRGDIPSASGMSSSSALLVLSALALFLVPEVAANPRLKESVGSTGELCAFMGAIESGYDFGSMTGGSGVGLRGGSQDHTAIIMGREGVVGLFGYHPVQRLHTLAWPDDMRLLVGVSGVSAPKATSARERYNNASDLARRIGEEYARRHGISPAVLGAVIEASAFEESEVIELIDSIATSAEDRTALWHRFAQFHDECTVVIPGAVEAWESADWSTFGQMVARSQQMAHEWLGNQVPETVRLVEMALESGAVAASSFGAGFGGAAWAMARKSDADTVLRTWSGVYREAFPAHRMRSDFFFDEAGSGVQVVGANELLSQLLEAC